MEFLGKAPHRGRNIQAEPVLASSHQICFRSPMVRGRGACQEGCPLHPVTGLRKQLSLGQTGGGLASLKTTVATSLCLAATSVFARAKGREPATTGSTCGSGPAWKSERFRKRRHHNHSGELFSYVLSLAVARGRIRKRPQGPPGASRLCPQWRWGGRRWTGLT